MPDAAQFQREFALAMTGHRPADLFDDPGFALYRNTWVKGLVDALAANYPVVAELLGPHVFTSVAVEYTRAERSRSPVLALYGEGFPGYLAAHSISEELPYLADVARLERLWIECFFAADDEPLDPITFAEAFAKEAAGLRPTLRTAARLARFETPAVTIWAAHKEGGFEELEPAWQPEHALVVRRDASVAVLLLSEPEAQLLSKIVQNCSLEEAITAVAADHPSAELPPIISNIISSSALTLSSRA